MSAKKSGIGISLVLGCMANVWAVTENGSVPVLPTPAYYRSAEPATAHLLFSECKVPKDDALKERCSLISSRIEYLEGRLKSLCRDAGESISRTVDDVPGVYVRTPNDDAYQYFHEHEKSWEIFVIPMLKPHYRFWEVERSWQGNKIANCSYKPQLHDTTCKGLAEPEARYSISWRPLTSNTEQLQESIFGDELTVSDLRTNETLATRRFYFYVVKDYQISAGSGRYIPTPGIRNMFRTFIRACPNYSPKEDAGFRDMRPRHSIEFISRVLRPMPLMQ